jgi:hypothetical protein
MKLQGSESIRGEVHVRKSISPSVRPHGTNMFSLDGL